MLIEEQCGTGLSFLHKLTADLLDQLPPMHFTDLLKFLLLVGIECGMILLSSSSAICLSCSNLSTGLRKVFFFSASSLGISCWMIGTTCCFCSAFRPRSIENRFRAAFSGLRTNCGEGIIS